MKFRNLRFSVIIFLLCLNIASLSAQQSFTTEQYTSDFDSLWRGLRDNYVYFDKKLTDWNRVRELYSPVLKEVKSKNDFISLLEKVLDELYDNHASLNTNLKTSPRLVPTGLDIWAEWISGRVIITQLRSGFSAEQAGLRPGMEITMLNGVPIEEAVRLRIPRSLKSLDDEVKNWALRAVLAGTHDKMRVISAKDRKGTTAVYKLDLPTQTTVDNYSYESRVEWKMFPGRRAYIRINDLISSEVVAQFDSALENVKTSRGLILDLRDILRGGNTDVAEPIMGRLIDQKMGYQAVIPLHDSSYIKQVAPSGSWTYKAPVVVLVNRWTASMGEGMAIGLDAMKRAVIVGTRMAGLNGGIFNMQLPNTKVGISYAGEKLNHINGTPREDFVPPVLVNLLDDNTGLLKDPILEAGRKKLEELITGHTDKPVIQPPPR